MTLLGIDSGEKHMGLAIGDTETGMVAPFKHCAPRSEEERYRMIDEAFKESGASKIVIGLPLSFRFRKTKMSEKIKLFASELNTRLHVPVEFENEVLTSALASRYLGYQKGQRKKHDQHAFAAALILESYIERKKNKNNL